MAGKMESVYDAILGMKSAGAARCPDSVVAVDAGLDSV
jgi:hypothetical protein